MVVKIKFQASAFPEETVGCQLKDLPCDIEATSQTFVPVDRHEHSREWEVVE